MKTRNGFISNSSSTVYVITNRTMREVDLVKFVEENPGLVSEFNREYGCEYSIEELLRVAMKTNITWEPGEDKICEFGDHDGNYAYTALGEVYDYILRRGGESESFRWRFLRHNR